jgi:uncharacterized protein (DUF983 family)
MLPPPGKKKRIGNIFINVLTEKCPNCGEGQVFEKNAKFFSIPVMKRNCDKCGYRFDREPGYFIGAMYLSYGLAVFEGLVTFLICHFFFPRMATIWVPLLIMLVILVFSIKNFKLSRILYIHIFPW